MAALTITDATLRPIADKVLAGERLSFDDGVDLYKSPDLLAVGWLAHHRPDLLAACLPDYPVRYGDGGGSLWFQRVSSEPSAIT